MIALAPDERTLYASNDARDEVLVINLDGAFVEQSIRVGDGPLGLDVSPDGRFVMVANSTGASVSLIDTERRLTVAEIRVGLSGASAPLDVLFVGPRTAYVTLQGEPGVAVVRVLE
jgi:YVTN family beta-propeller protein